MQRRSLSLHARQLLAAFFGLLAFLALTGYALDRAFLDTAENNLRERMRIYAFGYYGNMNFDQNGNFETPYGQAPDPRFEQPGSGLYAGLASTNVRWESASSLGRTLPEPKEGKAGELRFEGPLNVRQGDGATLRIYQFTQTTIWETARGDVPISFSVYQDERELQEQVAVFRKALWRYLGMAGILLLLVQTLVLRWSLIPVSHLQQDLDRVRRGVSLRLQSSVPRELQPVSDSINDLIDSERNNLEQSRNTLSDLAHSLKTPLAVLRARLEASSSETELREEVNTQLKRMNDIVSYQLSRASRSGHALFSAPVEIQSSAEEIVQSLEKVYAQKKVLCEFEIDDKARFHGEKGDLQELLGNLLENAFKWAKQRVILRVQMLPAPTNRRPGVLFYIEDDGPGIAADKVALLLQRGVRGDERVQGHGVGLSIVQDIVSSYQGRLDVDYSQELGGARFAVKIPPLV
jgi:two-component system, OmpR family, sensor histidine kinase PhoQ